MDGSSKDRIHEVYCRFKDLAIELGRTPKIKDLEQSGILGRTELDRVFGGISQLAMACGLEPAQKRRKVDNSIFEKSIEKHLEEYDPKIQPPPFKPFSFTPTVILGDIHFPFAHEEKLKKAVELIGKIKPKRVIQMGDLYDCLSHAKFPRSLNIYTPREEMLLARNGAEAMWKEIQRLVPGVECHQLLGNHDVRMMKQVLEKYPELEMFVDFEKWFIFDGVKSHMNIREEVVIDGIVYIHGYRSKLGEHMEFMRRPVVCGHSHRPGIVYKNYGDAVLFEMNVGYLGDPESKALSYTAQRHTHWSHGVGVITELGPQFVMI